MGGPFAGLRRAIVHEPVPCSNTVRLFQARKATRDHLHQGTVILVASESVLDVLTCARALCFSMFFYCVLENITIFYGSIQ